MKTIFDKNTFNRALELASKFSSGRISSIQSLQGVLLKGEKGHLHFYSSNLNSFFHTKIKAENEKDFSILVEPKKINEYINYLPGSKIEIEAGEKQLVISQEKTRGTFPIMNQADFPLPPEIKEKKQTIKTAFLKTNLPLILFSAAQDESRPTLTGVNFISGESQLTMVTTDGFRLSLIKTDKQTGWPSFIVPATFLEEIQRLIFDKEEVAFAYSSEEKLLYFSDGKNEFFSRLIEGEFPAFEKVIPEKTTTRVVLDKEELLRGVKQASVFARDLANVILLNFKKEEISIKPKTETEENQTIIEGEVEGEPQKVAFNYKFLVEFLNRAESNKITIEILRPDAPIIFRVDKKPNYLHLIMPVRIQE